MDVLVREMNMKTTDQIVHFAAVLVLSEMRFPRHLSFVIISIVHALQIGDVTFSSMGRCQK